MLMHKGYMGHVEFDDEAEIFHGEVINTRDIITFQGSTVTEIKKAFKVSIDDYLDFCKERNEEPEKPLQLLKRIDIMFSSKKSPSNDPTLIKIGEDNLPIYINLARAYEAEFSSLTHNMPNELGIFEPDTLPNPPYLGYLLYHNKLPIGFCVAEITDKLNDVAEFYVAPIMRKNGLGAKLASLVFDLHPGLWHVRQITGADAAKAFWRKVIGAYTQNQYTESVVEDAHWGHVTRQEFVARGNACTPSQKHL